MLARSSPKSQQNQDKIMIDLDRRTTTFLALLAPFFAGAAAAQTSADKMPDMDRDMSKVPWKGNEQIAMLIYPGMTVMDLIGPHCMFSSLMGAKIDLVAKTLEPVTSDAGVTIIPSATFQTCPRDLTVLFTPGGTDGTLAAAADPDTLAFMADRGARSKYVTSVCSGSLILGAAGLLKGYRASSHWSCRDALAGFGAIPTDARVVRDRNRITGAGVTSGLDFGLSMVAELRGQIYAECTQLVSEYDPDPPFNAGSLKTAPADVKAAMIKLLEGFTQKAEALAAASRI
jgi:putative intracellular protease/amidase